MDIANDFQIIKAIQDIAHTLASVFGCKLIDYNSCLLIRSELNAPFLDISCAIHPVHEPIYNVALVNLLAVLVFQPRVLTDGGWIYFSDN